MFKMDFGCGDFRNLNCGVGLDVRDCAGATHIHRGDPPTLFLGKTFDYIYTNHAMEHLDHPCFLKWMDEFGRLLVCGGKLHIFVPHWSCGFSAWNSLDHKRAFGIASFFAYDKDSQKEGIFPEYGDGKWKVVKVALHYRPHRLQVDKSKPFLLMWLYKAIAVGVDFFANLSVVFCERVWATWVGGFAEVEFVLERV